MREVVREHKQSYITTTKQSKLFEQQNSLNYLEHFFLRKKTMLGAEIPLGPCVVTGVLCVCFLQFIRFSSDKNIHSIDIRGESAPLVLRYHGGGGMSP